VTGASVLGAGFASFAILTLGLFGFAAAMTGQALARRWRPVRQLLLYALLLAAGDRFLLFALFGGTLLSAGGFIIAYLLLLGAALLAYRLTQAQCMVRQYPWLYQRAGPFGWRARSDRILATNLSKEGQP